VRGERGEALEAALAEDEPLGAAFPGNWGLLTAALDAALAAGAPGDGPVPEQVVRAAREALFSGYAQLQARGGAPAGAFACADQLGLVERVQGAAGAGELQKLLANAKRLGPAVLGLAQIERAPALRGAPLELLPAGVPGGVRLSAVWADVWESQVDGLKECVVLAPLSKEKISKSRRLIPEKTLEPLLAWMALRAQPETAAWAKVVPCKRLGRCPRRRRSAIWPGCARRRWRRNARKICRTAPC
jgi:hypothetical protein